MDLDQDDVQGAQVVDKKEINFGDFGSEKEENAEEEEDDKQYESH